MKQRLITLFLQLLGESDMLFVRDQNDRLAHALRRMQRENDKFERFINRKREEWVQLLKVLQASIAMKKLERNYFREQLQQYHLAVVANSLHDPSGCPICEIVKTKHPLDVKEKVPA